MITNYSNTLVLLALTQAAQTTGAHNGVALDTQLFNNNFRDVTFAVVAATVTDGTHVVTLEESDTSGSGYAAISAGRVQGTVPTTIASTDSNKVFSFGARPTKRWVRVVVTTSGATTGGVIGAVAVLGNSSIGPVARS